MIRQLLAESFARLPKIERPIHEVLFAGYYRICHTDDLIKAVLEGNIADLDRLFWTQAAQEEQGHSDLYRKDLQDFCGDQYQNYLSRYIPCPEMCALMQWARETPVQLGVYRAYLESALVGQDDLARRAFSAVLPRTAEVHLALDPCHVEECSDYLAHFPIQQITEHIKTVEAAFEHESLWSGFTH